MCPICCQFLGKYIFNYRNKLDTVFWNYILNVLHHTRCNQNLAQFTSASKKNIWKKTLKILLFYAQKLVKLVKIQIFDWMKRIKKVFMYKLLCCKQHNCKKQNDF